MEEGRGWGKQSFGAWRTHQPSYVTNSANARLQAAQRPHSVPFRSAFISQGDDWSPANTVIDPLSLGAGMCNVQVTAQLALKQLHFTPLTTTDCRLPGADTIPSRIFVLCSMQLTTSNSLRVLPPLAILTLVYWSC